MTTQSHFDRSHTAARSSTRTVAMMVAAATVPLLLSAPSSGAGSAGPPQSAAPVSSRAPTLPGSAGETVFGSYLGGQEWDEASGVAADRRGDSLVAGFTLSEDFPKVGVGVRGHDAIVDAFVTKIDRGSSRVAWSTQLGGVDLDAATAIAVDRAGNSYVVGRTGSVDFPTRGAMQPRLAGRACTGAPCHDAFVTKLSPRGRIVWSTYLGGTGNEEALGVAVDDDANVYVTGLTDSSDLPVKGAFQTRFQSRCPGDLPCPYDAFVTKLAPSGSRIIYSTYLGGRASDVARGIDVDSDGSAYVAGSTASTDFPRVRAFQSNLRGTRCGPPPGEPCRQAFLTKLRPSGRTAAYSTYLGGKKHDDAYDVAVDVKKRAHLTGATQSTDFPRRNAFQPTLNTQACTSAEPHELCDDGFATKFGRSGRALRYSTFVGGAAQDQGLNIDITSTGSALLAGRTDSSDFPVTANAAQPDLGGSIDGFAMRLRTSGTPAWSTFLGGNDADRATGVSADPTGAAHLAGRTLSPDFPTVRPFQPTLEDDDYDAFVSVIK